jgi:hypothetical protein
VLEIGEDERSPGDVADLEGRAVMCCKADQRWMALGCGPGSLAGAPDLLNWPPGFSGAQWDDHPARLASWIAPRARAITSPVVAGPLRGALGSAIIRLTTMRWPLAARVK